MKIKPPLILISVAGSLLVGAGLIFFLNAPGCIGSHQSRIAQAATAAPTVEPAHVPFYELPTPAPALPTPEPASPTPLPAYTPDPEVLAYVNAALAQRPWMQINDQWVNGLPLPEQTTIAFRREPHIEKQELDGQPIWKVTFYP